MAICTWLQEDELEKLSKVSDSDLNELFQEVRQKLPNDYYISEREVTYGGWFGKKKTEMVYTVYHALKMPEVQVMNFYRHNSVTSINTCITKEMLMAYFFGLLSGLNTK